MRPVFEVGSYQLWNVDQNRWVSRLPCTGADLHGSCSSKGRRSVCLRYRAGLNLPYVPCILCYSSVARKLARGGDIQDRFTCPFLWIRKQSSQFGVCLEIGFKIRQVHVMVAMGEKNVTQWLENSRLVGAKMIGENQIQSGPCFRIIFIVPLRAVPASVIGDLLSCQTEQEKILFVSFLRHLDRCSVASPDC